MMNTINFRYLAISCGFLVTSTLVRAEFFAYDRAIAAAQRGDIDQAQQSLQNLVIDHPDRADILYDAGVVAAQKEEFEPAVAYFDHAAQVPTAPAKLKEQAHFNHGNALVQLKKLDDAIVQYEATLALNKDNEQARHNLEVVKKMREQQKEEEQKQSENPDEQHKEQQQNQEQTEQDQQREKSDNSDDQKQQEQDKQQQEKQHNEHSSDKQQDSSKHQNESEQSPQQKQQQKQDRQHDKQPDKQQDNQKKDSKQSPERKQQKDKNESQNFDQNDDKRDQKQPQEQKGKPEKDGQQLQNKQQEQAGRADQKKAEQKKSGQQKTGTAGTDEKEQAGSAALKGTLPKDWVEAVLMQAEEQDARNNKQMMRALVGKSKLHGEDQNGW